MPAYFLCRAFHWQCQKLQAENFDVGHAILSGANDLAELIPDKQQRKAVARLLRGLLHPNPACRLTADEALKI